ncbi:Transporter [Candidatus Hydrogenisulfobacillus filiaventi]|uniref:Transporter n=1 Tax=Candidatus Hydrogenisulfobacillus filiaventi TaxID=2707344 RepID=A0A6F8ZKE6_9FIRM|nr:transporter [Bacillota bacterium]CAB1130268.1 Transporter [Candidatus Hydrogenisulfobacillus filiaventi]
MGGRGKRVATIGLMFIGAVAGAGFASGQEIWQFFGRHGPAGRWGLLLVVLSFWVVGVRALEHGQASQGRLDRFLAGFYPPRWVPVLEGAWLAFLAGQMALVAVGAGWTLGDLTGWPRVWGAGLTMLLTVATVLGGAGRVLRVNNLLTPLLMALMLAVAGLHRPHGVPAPGAAGGWWHSAGLYAAYNGLMGLVVLIALGPQLRARPERLAAAGLGALGLGALALAVWAVVATLPQPGQLPMVEAARRIGPGWGRAYALGLWVALFTTGVGEGFALVSRFGRRAAWSLLLAVGLAGWGFRELLVTLYPIMSVLAVLFLLPLIRHPRQIPSL